MSRHGTRGLFESSTVLMPLQICNIKYLGLYSYTRSTLMDCLWAQAWAGSNPTF